MIGQFIKKELLRVFTDKKLIVSLFVLPIVILVGIFGLIGYMVQNMAKDIDKHINSVYVQNAPDNFIELSKTIDLSEFDIKYISLSEDDMLIKQNIKDGNTDLLIVFDEGFMDKVNNYMNEESLPQIKTYYNDSENYSSSARKQYLEKAVTPFRTQLLTERFGNINNSEVFNIDADNTQSVIQDENKATGKMLGMLLPYMITILLFASVMSVGVDSIAGEKERGTMATLLLTPASRTSIILGKMFGLTIISILSALMYGISAAIGTPLLMSRLGEQMSLSVSYTPVQIIQLLSTILIMSTNYVGVIALVSALCKNTKEATTYVTPVYMLIIVSGILTMYGSENPSLSSYFIPIYNCSLALKGILTMELTTIEFLITSLVSLALTGILVFVMTKVFDNEKIMLNA